MGQSLSQLYIHLTFGTKNRFPLKKPEWNKRMHAYLAGIFKSYESPAIIINSVKDHVHIFFRLSKNFALAKVVEEIKKESSKWIKEIDASNSKFSWQTGYGAFSVSSSKVDTVRRYIQDQHEHHKKLSYQAEVEQFLKEYGLIEYNSEYFWR